MLMDDEFVNCNKIFYTLNFIYIVPCFIDFFSSRHSLSFRISANMSALVCDDIQKAESVLEHTSEIPSLRTIIVVDLPPEGIYDTKHRFEAAGLRLMSFDDVIDAGTSHSCDPEVS